MLLEKKGEILKNNLIIGISGGSGSGKTTLANKLCEELGIENTVIINQDSYYFDQSHLPYSERNKLNFDSPKSVDFSLLLYHLNELKNDKMIKKPNYCFSNHSR